MNLLDFISASILQVKVKLCFGESDAAIVNATIYFIVDLIDSLITIVEEEWQGSR